MGDYGGIWTKPKEHTAFLASEFLTSFIVLFLQERIHTAYACMEFGGSVLFIVLGNLRGKFTIFILLIEAFLGMLLHVGRREWVTKEGRKGNERRGSDPNVPPFDE
jgi:hypothetical protein